MNPEQALTALLATHAATLQALLPACRWPVAPDAPARAWGNDFVVYELGQLPDGRWAKLHHFLRADTGPPHCHCCDLDSIGLVGSYVERRYLPDGSRVEVVRGAGGRHAIAAETIHKLVALPEGDAWTLVFTGPAAREGRHHPELLD
jgi:hypothetical protein